MLDWFHIYRNQHDLSHLDNYFAYETKNVIDKRTNFINQIQTSREFYPEERMKRFKNMQNLESKDVRELEDVILSWHREISDFDSLSSIADRLSINRTDILQAKDQRIRSFYELRYEQELLEYLSLVSSTTSIADYFGFDLVRNIGEDSVYIGNYTMSDDHYMFAFLLNNLYFHSNSEGVYKIPLSDTLNVEMLIMGNRKTYIDTIRQKQTIVKKDDVWRSKAEILPKE